MHSQFTEWLAGTACSVPAREVNGHGVPPGPFLLTFQFQLNYSYLWSVRVSRVRVSFYLYSMDNKSFSIAIDVFAYGMACQ